MEEREDTDVINVEWFAEPYGTVQIEARYWLYQKGSENFFGELEFVKEHFQQMYDSFLEHLFVEYTNNPLEDVWNEETGESERIEFSKKEELHPYLGMAPSIDIKSYKGYVLFGLSFYKHNRISIEHGLCAIYNKLDLVLMDSYDFLGMVDNFKYEDYYDEVLKRLL